MDDATGLVDVHVHLLVGLDDGPARLDDALALCRALVDQGVTRAAATCHQGGVFSRNGAPGIREAAINLQQSLDHAGIALECYPSAEWMLDSQAVDHFAERLPNLLTIADTGRYSLVEFPFSLPGYTKLVCEMLRNNGIRPVLAHVEKYPSIASHPARVQQLRDEGYLIQVNADSIAGPASAPLARECRTLVRSGLVHLVASDAHSVDQRPPLLRDAYDVVSGWTDQATARLLFEENPRAILEGRDVVDPEPAGWFSRFRRR